MWVVLLILLLRSGPASVVLGWWGRSVRSTGSRPDLRIGRRRSGCPANDLSAGPQLFQAPTGAAGLICLAWARGRGSQVRAASGCVPSLTSERDDSDHRRDTSVRGCVSSGTGRFLC